MTTNEIPSNQYEEYTSSIFGAAVPKAELHNPRVLLRLEILRSPLMVSWYPWWM